jgi:hypothetical protein
MTSGVQVAGLGAVPAWRLRTVKRLLEGGDVRRVQRRLTLEQICARASSSVAASPGDIGTARRYGSVAVALREQTSGLARLADRRQRYAGGGST